MTAFISQFLKPLLWIGIAGPLVLSYICEAIMSPHVGDIVMGTLVVGGLLGWIVYATRYNKEKWPPLKAIWDKSFICLRCRTTFQHN